MTKHWGILATFALAACSGHSIPSAGPVSAELHTAPAFAPIRTTKIDAIDASMEFVSTQARALGLNGHAAFTVLRGDVGQDGLSHVRLQQSYDGVKVWGSDIVVHHDGENVVGVNGTLLGGLTNLDLAPSLADTTAMTAAKSDYMKSAKDPSAVVLSRESTELVVMPTEDGSAHLAWHVIFSTLGSGKAGPAGIWNYFIDAHDGSIVDHFNNLQTVEASGPGGNTRVKRTWNMNLDVTASGANYIMKTAQYETKNATTNKDYSGTSLTNYNMNDPGANDAHGFAEVTIKMLKDWQNYNSIDNKGLVLVSNVHAGQLLGTDDNAAWDGSSMNYGDGDAAGGDFFEFTGALDVIAHEIDHGFTEFHSGLNYSGQSGGMNESFSDIAGTAAKFYMDAKTADFNLGGDIFQQANTYIRYMCKPSMDGMSIDTATAYKSGLDVHYSSGVMNRAFCRSAKRLSGADPDTGTATADGVKKASQAFYEANASQWTSTSTWAAGCDGVIKAATALKFSPGDISGLGDSWKDVGVTCTYTHVNDFGLTLTPATATAMAGTTATYTVNTAIPAGNTAQSVALTITGLPAGVTGTFAPATVMSGASSTLTIQTAYDTAQGDISFKVTGTGTATPHDASGTLTVTMPPPDLTPLPVADMATGGTGGNGNGNNGGGGSGCSMSGNGGSPMSALFFVALALVLVARQRRANVRKMTATSRMNV